MSIVSSRISSVSSILKTPGVRAQLIRQANRVYFKLPKNIKSILYNYETGNGNKEYEELIHLLRETVVKDNDLSEFLTEVRQCLSILGPKHKLFIEVLLQIEWTNKSPEVTTNYKLFLEDLVCTQNHYTKMVIDHIVALFKPAENNNEERKPGEFKNEDVERLNHLHDVLYKILKVIPMSSKLLLQSLISWFPYIVHGTYIHEIYVYALLQIPNYTPQLRSDILSLIINRLMILDVNIPREEITNDEEDDYLDYTSDHDGTADNDDASIVNDGADKTKIVHPLAHTLDTCMELLLQYMHEFCFTNDVLQIDSVKKLYFDILQAFESVILSTHNSQYVQYIIFYVCSFKTAVVEAFINWLWCKVNNPNIAPITRQLAVAYISSLLATATFIPVGLVKLTISKLIKWIHNYISIQESLKYIDNSKMHDVFYSVCQAFFYVFIAKYNAFVGSKNSILFLQELDIPSIISCRLNPLNVCDAEIVRNFADITKTYQLAYCYTIIENNTRNQLPSFGNEICSSIIVPKFFPFRSYTLEYSGQRIAPLCDTNVLNVSN